MALLRAPSQAVAVAGGGSEPGPKVGWSSNVSRPRSLAVQSGAGGRGLMLARSFSLQVGWYATETTKHIWATFPIEH